MLGSHSCPALSQPLGRMQQGDLLMKKPQWVVDKERDKRAAANHTVWLFGLHAVRAKSCD